LRLKSQRYAERLALSISNEEFNDSLEKIMTYGIFNEISNEYEIAIEPRIIISGLEKFEAFKQD